MVEIVAWSRYKVYLYHIKRKISVTIKKRTIMNEVLEQFAKGQVIPFLIYDTEEVVNLTVTSVGEKTLTLIDEEGVEYLMDDCCILYTIDSESVGDMFVEMSERERVYEEIIDELDTSDLTFEELKQVRGLIRSLKNK